jgi:hypothetical protein
MNFLSSPRYWSPPPWLQRFSQIGVLAGFAAQNQRTKFGEIDVERVNVVEPDGTLRLVISNQTEFPGAIYHGKEYPHPDRKTAGRLFFNDEGNENGGMIFGGSKDATGHVQSYGHLSFDPYEQDPIFTIDAGKEAGQRTSALSVWEGPDSPMSDVLTVPQANGPEFLLLIRRHIVESI